MINDELKKGSKIIKSTILKIPKMRDTFLLGEKLAREVDMNQFINKNGDIDFDNLNNYLSDKYGEEVAFCGPTFCVAWLMVAIVQDLAVAINVSAFTFCYYWVRNNCNKNVQITGLDDMNKLESEKIVNQIYNAL